MTFQDFNMSTAVGKLLKIKYCMITYKIFSSSLLSKGWYCLLRLFLMEYILHYLQLLFQLPNLVISHNCTELKKKSQEQNHFFIIYESLVNISSTHKCEHQFRTQNHQNFVTPSIECLSIWRNKNIVLHWVVIHCSRQPSEVDILTWEMRKHRFRNK